MLISDCLYFKRYEGLQLATYCVSHVSSLVKVFGSESSAACCVCVYYHRYIEIAIKQCRSSGIDWKIHGLILLGRIRAEEEDLAAVPFLASDNEEEEDEKGNSGR